jgi:LPXTG-motif cell wall-anchored protein
MTDPISKKGITLKKIITAIAMAGAMLLAVPTAAHAGGSDSPTPYTVDSAGITLPSPDTFPDGGHVNLQTSAGGKGIHFESLNNQPSGQWIGQSFIPWSAFGLTDCDTVSWVQVSLYNEHFGEGGQSPVTVGNCAPPEDDPPVEEPPVTPEEPPVTPEEPEEPVTPPAPPAPPAEDRLPATGADLMPFGLVGLALLVAGGAAIGVRKLIPERRER